MANVGPNRATRRRLKLNYALSQDIDPVVALELFPGKIANMKRLITDTALELSMGQEIPDYPERELEELRRALRLRKALLAEYENRFEMMKRIAAGETDDAKKDGLKV